MAQSAAQLDDLRRAESAACKNIGEILAAEKRWKAEDAAAAEQAQRRTAQRSRQYDAAANDRSVVEAVGRFVGTIAAELRKEIRELGEQVEALQRRPVVHDAGVWRDGHGYDAGSLVSHGGGGWIAQRDTTAGERPGTSPGWRLAVKSDLAEVRKVVKQELGRQ
jgi:hypothetical protein